MKLRQILKRSIGVSFDFDGSISVSSGGLLFTSCHAMNLSNCESVKGAFLKIMGFAGKRFLFSPLLPLPAPPVSVAIAPIFAPPKSEKCHERVGKPTETVATQANLVIKARRGARNNSGLSVCSSPSEVYKFVAWGSREDRLGRSNLDLPIYISMVSTQLPSNKTKSRPLTVVHSHVSSACFLISCLHLGADMFIHRL